MTPDLLRRMSLALTTLAALVFVASLIGATAQRVVIVLAMILLLQALPVMWLHHLHGRQRAERAETLIERRGGKITALLPASGDRTQIIGVSLAGCLLDPQDLSRLAGLPSLETLDLSGAAGIDDAALAHLDRFPRLTTLDISFTAVSDSSLPLLAKMSQLETVIAREVDFSAEALADIMLQAPRLAIVRSSDDNVVAAVTRELPKGERNAPVPGSDLAVQPAFSQPGRFAT